MSCTNQMFCGCIDGTECKYPSPEPATYLHQECADKIMSYREALLYIANHSTVSGNIKRFAIAILKINE